MYALVGLSRAVGSPPWSKATAPIWAHVSGYAPRLRGSAGLAFLRAFADDSAAQTGDKRLFYSGYLHRADAWADFSEAWDFELHQWPAIEYFKASGDQFNGWDASIRDAKIAKLARVIRHFEPISFQFSLNRKLFEDELKPVSPYGLGRPHLVGCFAVVAGITQMAPELGIDTPIEFIFDQQDGVDADVKILFSGMLDSLSPEARKLVAGDPWFKDDRDKQFMPLQAADMLAWHVRRQHEYPDKRLAILADLTRPSGHLMGEIPDDMIRSWAAHHSTVPGVELVKTRNQWAKFSREHKRLVAARIDRRKITRPGIYYPEGTPFIAKLIDRIRRLFRAN